VPTRARIVYKHRQEMQLEPVEQEASRQRDAVPVVVVHDRPRLRGVLHQWSAAAAFGAGAVLVGMCRTPRAMLAAGVYAASLLTLLTISATYHRLDWKPRARERMRSLDHAAIFVLIAGTYTPLGLLAVGGAAGTRLALFAWACALIGILKSVVWSHSPKVVTAALAVAVGWCIVPYLGEVGRALDAVQLALVFGGGLFYTSGAVAYATRRPNPVPGVFGYHEVFHACTLVAAALHFAAVARMVKAAG
jgi:hemolysin III